MLVSKSSYGVDDEFANYFEKLGYGVTYEGRIETGERWHEIYTNEGIICQVSFGTPLAEFLADLPYLVDGKAGIGPTNYWCACDSNTKLREMLSRVQKMETA